MLRLICVLLFVGCASTSLDGEVHPDPTPLPTEECGGLFLAQVQINGRDETHSFLVDTGAARTVVDSGFFPVPTHINASLDELRWGRFQLRDEPVQVADLRGLSHALGRPIDGILGYATFRGWTLTIDGPTRSLLISHGGLPEPDGIEVFASAGDDGPYLPVEVGDHTEDVLLDTGANGGLELASFDEQLFSEGPRAISATRTLRQVALREVGRLAYDLTLGVDVLERPLIGRARGTPIVGMAILRWFELSIDPAAGRLALRRANPAPIRTPSSRGFGLGFRTRPEGLEVIHVLEGGPGAKAGVLVGDLIETIGGRPAGERSCDGLLRPGEASAPVPLRVRRGDEVLELGVPVEVLVR